MGKNTDRAKELRKNMTDAEKTLWYFLRAKRFENLKFRRQQPIGDYIVDFVCFQQDLIVEVDGSQHLDNEDYDQERTNWLESEGFQVIRFWNNDVLNKTEQVLEKIKLELD